MQVGDLVRHKNFPMTGIVLKVFNGSGNGFFTEYRCLWSDGDIGNIVYWLVTPCK